MSFPGLSPGFRSIPRSGRHLPPAQSLLNRSLTYLSAGAGPCSVVGGLGGARDSRGGCHETKACISKTISFFSLES